MFLSHGFETGSMFCEVDFDLDCLTSWSLNSAFKAGTRYRCPDFYGSMLWAKDAELFYYPIQADLEVEQDSIGDESASAVAAGRHFSS